ncbi:tail collar fiber protein [Vibrio phage D69]
MAITQVGIATLSEELLQYIKDQIKNGTLSFTDLIDGPEYAGQDGKFLQAYSGSGSTGMQWQDLPSAGLNWQVEDTDFLAQDKIGILASNGITITLPSDPEEGNLVAIADHNSEFDVTPVTVVGSGGYLIEDESDLVLDLRNAYVQLIFDGTKWEIAQVNHPFNIQEITEETFPSGQISYTLSRIPPSRSSILVTSGGKIIPTSQYSLVGNVLSFGAVASDIIQVRHIGVPKATEVSDTPVGAMLYFPNSEPVDGWLDCNGSSISASVYPDLVKFLTKNPQAEIAYLPDARGNFIRTFDYGNGTDVIAPHSIDNILKDNKWGRWISTTNEATSENLWDGSTATRTTVLVSQGYIGYRFDAPVTMTDMILNNNDAIGTQHLPDTGIVRASHDGITWVDASNTVTLGATSQGRNTTFTVTTNDAYRFWSIHGTGGQPYADGSGEYWGVTSLYMNGSSTNRIVGGFQEQSVGPMPATTLGGTAAGTLAVASGAGANVLGQGGSGQVSGGGETRPDNQSYVLRIKAFHYQSGDLASTDVTALRDEVSRLSGQVNDGTSYVGPDAPENPSENARWYDTTSGRTYIWFNDGDSYQWVDDSPQAASTAQESLNAAEILSTGSQTAEALNNRFARNATWFDTVADMVSGYGLLAEGYTAITRGYYEAGDGGGAEYLITTGNSGDGYGSHDVGTNTAVLQHNGTVYSKQYGLIEKDSYYDTIDQTDGWISNNLRINAFVRNPEIGHCIFNPSVDTPYITCAGSILIDRGDLHVTIQPQARIYGRRTLPGGVEPSSVGLYSAGGLIVVADYTDPDNGDYTIAGTLSNFTFDGKGQMATIYSTDNDNGGIGIYNHNALSFAQVTNVSLRDFKISECDHVGINFDLDSRDILIENVNVSNTSDENIKVKGDGQVSGAYANVTIRDCALYNSRFGGRNNPMFIWVSNCNATIEGVSMSCTNSSIATKPQGVFVSGCENVTVNSCILNNCSQGVRMYGDSLALTVSNNYMEDCEFIVKRANIVGDSGNSRLTIIDNRCAGDFDALYSTVESVTTLSSLVVKRNDMSSCNSQLDLYLPASFPTATAPNQVDYQNNVPATGFDFNFITAGRVWNSKPGFEYVTVSGTTFTYDYAYYGGGYDKLAIMITGSSRNFPVYYPIWHSWGTNGVQEIYVPTSDDGVTESIQMTVSKSGTILTFTLVNNPLGTNFTLVKAHN